MLQVLFEDVAVYFSPAEWAELAEWQRDLYRAVMLENYKAVASLGYLSSKPEIICRIEQQQEPCMEEVLESPKRRRPQSPSLGDGIRMAEEEEEEEDGRTGPAWQRPAQRKRTKNLPAPESAKQDVPPLVNDDMHPRLTLKMNPPKCPECGKSFLSNVAMAIHIRTHTGERPFKCHLCPKGFPSQGDLKRHIKTHLKMKEHPDAGAAAPKEKKCLTAKLQLLRQLGAAPGPKKPHTCGQCGKSFNKKQDLRKHQGTHSTERPFSCHDCGRSFRLKQILVSHMKVHGGERPYACTQCGKRFGQKHHVESHQRVHTGEKPFSCTTCGKRYAQKQPLISHLRVHTGERPYACAECGKRFRNQATLTIHNRMHTGERPYRCLLCGKACSQLQHLKSHQRVHRGEQHLIEAGDSRALALKRAREVEEKPYQCSRCEKRFRNEKIMQTHLKTHEEKKAGKGGAGVGPGHSPPLPAGPGAGPRTKRRSPAGNRALACADCGRKFTQTKYLAMHQRSHP